MLRREIPERVAFLDPDRHDLTGLRQSAMPDQPQAAQYRPAAPHRPADATCIIALSIHRPPSPGLSHGIGKNHNVGKAPGLQN
jgi:hypothetical protein